jgi:twinkle protein
MIVNLNTIINQVEAVIKNPEKFSYKIDMLKDYYSFQLGRTTYFAGIPSHGKSTFLFEVLIQLSEIHGLKHVIFAPEEGGVADVYTTILSMVSRKRNRVGAFDKLSELDLYKHAAFISNHFHVYDTKEEAKTPYEIMEYIKPYILENEIKTVMLDPWNELKHVYSERQDIYLERVLGDIRLFSRSLNIHTFIVAHPRTLQKPKDSDTYSPPTAFEFSGGATWYAKADGIICVYRPKEFSEIESERTHVDILIQKAKRGIGRKGEIKLDYDIYEQRYLDRSDSTQEKRTITPAPF